LATAVVQMLSTFSPVAAGSDTFSLVSINLLQGSDDLPALRCVPGAG